MIPQKPAIRVKLVNRGSTGSNSRWGLQCPGGQGKWERCQFLFDPNERNYDWLVVIDDIPRTLPGRTEVLACPQQNTILVTTEPSSVTRYGRAFAAQFRHLITNQDERILPHPKAFRTQPGSVWFYEKTYDETVNMPVPEKTGLLSAIATDKQQMHTIHQARFDFTKKLVDQIPETDLLFSFESKEHVFNQLFNGISRFVEHKYDMIDPYKYHLAIGNQVGPDILTERISDSFLGYAVPLSYGCTNLADYFPKDSFIEIDIANPDETIRKIKSIIYDPDDYARRLSAVKEARRRVIEEYNLPAMLSRIIENAPSADTAQHNEKLYSRRIMRARHPMEFVRFAGWRSTNFIKQLRQRNLPL